MLPTDVLKILEEIASTPESYLVGGGVRDILLGRKLTDIDIALPEPDQVFRRLSLSSRYSKVILGEKKNQPCFRFVIAQENQHLEGRDCHANTQVSRFWLDIVDLQAGEILDNLALRDFTINAMALPLHVLIGFLKNGILFEQLKQEIIDPYNGMKDIGDRLLREVSYSIFIDDPLRLWRMWRFSGELGFMPTDSLLRLALADRDLCMRIPGERICYELFALLKNPEAAIYLTEAAEIGLLEAQFPELTSLKDCLQNDYHYQDVWDHSFQVLRTLELILANPDDYFKGEDYRSLVAEWLARSNNLQLLKLAALFHDIGKPLVRTTEADGKTHFYKHEKAGLPLVKRIAARLRLSSSDTSILSFLVKRHLQIHSLLNRASLRTRIRFWREHGENAVGLVLLGCADKLAKKAPPLKMINTEQFFSKLIPEFLDVWLNNVKNFDSLIPLLDGNDIMRIFGFSEGKEVGIIKESLLEAQLEGAISTKDDAVKLATFLVGKLLGK